MTDLQNIFDGKPTRDVPLSEYSLHDVAGLLKRFVRELPEPIFSVRLQNLFFAAMGSSCKGKQKKKTQSTLVFL